MSVLHVLRNDVQHANHLREDEHAVPGVLEPNQQLVQQQQFATALHQRLQGKNADMKAVDTIAKCQQARCKDKQRL